MKNKLNLSLDLRIVCVVLLAAILVMFGLWRPWQADSPSGRKITVNGTGKVTATPDYYQFNPFYQKATTAELNTQVSTVTAKLKELGVQEKDIQVQANAYQKPDAPVDASLRIPEAQDQSYAYLTIKVDNKELAQKVQDYIATSGAQGQLTPYPTFSEEKQKQLKNEARDKAIADARAQASKTAQNLDAKLGKVIEIKDADEYGGPITLESRSASGVNLDTKSSIPIFPGEQDVTFTVQAVFEIK